MKCQHSIKQIFFLNETLLGILFPTNAPKNLNTSPVLDAMVFVSSTNKYFHSCIIRTWLVQYPIPKHTGVCTTTYFEATYHSCYYNLLTKMCQVICKPSSKVNKEKWHKITNHWNMVHLWFTDVQLVSWNLTRHTLKNLLSLTTKHMLASLFKHIV